MDLSIIEKYVDKVYGYAINRTYSREEADELSQEILFTAVRELPKIRDESKFEPWLWGIANNVTKSFRRSMGKQRELYSYSIITDPIYEDEVFDDNEETYAYLREKIAMLSRIYRDIIVLYYYKGLSTKQIAKELNIPEGTVTWRLSEARKKLKKECNEMNETALYPKKMTLDIYGTGNYNGIDIPFPSEYINDALSQNILYYCYEKSASVEELAKIIGVPAYFIEDRVENLLKREAIREETKGKYRTDFVILTDKYANFLEENTEKTLMPIRDKIIETLKKIADEADKIDFYKAGKDKKDLFYLYGIFVFTYSTNRYWKLPWSELETKYDGYKWEYVGNMETGEHKRPELKFIYTPNGKGNYTYTSYFGLNGFSFRERMQNKYINVCEDIIFKGHTNDEYSLAEAIQLGYIIKKEDGSLFVTIPCFTTAQIKEFNKIIENHWKPLIQEYKEAITEFINEYKKLFPKHLEDDAYRLSVNLYIDLYTEIISYAQKNNLIEMPTENSYCDVLREHWY